MLKKIRSRRKGYFTAEWGMALKSYFTAWEPKRKEDTGLDNPGKNLQFGVNQLLLQRADPDWFRGTNTVCVTQGNSCPVITPYCEPKGR